MGHWQWRLGGLAAVILVLVMVWPSQALAAEATLDTPKVLPGSFRYTVMIWGEGTRGFFNFRPESRALYQSNLADKRLAEAKALIKLNKTELAKDTLAVYKDQAELAQKRLESIPDAKLGQARTAAILEQIKENGQRELGVIHEIDRAIQESSDDDLKTSLKTNGLTEAEQLVDKTNSIQKQPVLPPDLVSSLEDQLKLGIITKTELDALATKPTSRDQVRPAAEKMIEAGTLPGDFIARFDSAELDKFPESGQKIATFAAVQQFKAMQLSALTSQPTAEEQVKIEAFQKLPPGSPIPNEIKKFILPNLMGVLLTKELAVNSVNIDPSLFSSKMDQAFFKTFKEQFGVADGSGTAQVTNNKFVIPKDFNMANFSQILPMFASIQQQMQSEIVKAMTEFKQNAPSNIKDGNQFAAQLAAQFGFDPKDQRFVPPGFTPGEFQGNFYMAARPQNFGLPPLPKGQNGEPDQAELDQLIKEGKFRMPPVPNQNFGQFVASYGDKPPEEAARMFAPQQPGQFMAGFQRTGAPPPPPAFQGLMPNQNGNGNQSQPPQFFPYAYLGQNFRPPDEAMRSYEQNKGQFETMRQQFTQQQQDRKQYIPPAFNQLQQNGQLKDFERANQPGPNGQKNQPFQPPPGGYQMSPGATPPQGTNPTSGAPNGPNQNMPPSGQYNGSQPPPQPGQSSPQYQPPPNGTSTQPPPGSVSPPPGGQSQPPPSGSQYQPPANPQPYQPPLNSQPPPAESQPPPPISFLYQVSNVVGVI